GRSPPPAPRWRTRTTRTLRSGQDAAGARAHARPSGVSQPDQQEPDDDRRGQPDAEEEHRDRPAADDAVAEGQPHDQPAQAQEGDAVPEREEKADGAEDHKTG